MSALLEFVVSESFDKGMDLVETKTGVVGGAVWVTRKIYAYADMKDQQLLEKCQRHFGCDCIKRVTGWGPPTALAAAYVAHEKHGCAFSYEGMYVFHPQTDFDVQGASAIVFRFDDKTGWVGNYKGHVQQCNCSRAPLKRQIKG